VKPNGLWIGSMPGNAFADHLDSYSIKDFRGRALAMFSDGVNECTDPNGLEFGLHGIKNFLSSASGGSAETAESLFGVLNNFRSGTELKDDTTIIIIQSK